MYFKLVTTPELVQEFIKTLEEQPSINQVSTLGTVRDNQIKTMLFGAFYYKSIVSYILYDDLDKIVGITSITFATSGPFWYINYGYMCEYGRKTYGTQAMYAEAYRAGWSVARERNCHESYFIQRNSRARLLKLQFERSDILDKFAFDIVEVIEPYNLSINPLVNTVMLGAMAGKNPKKLALVRMYDPEKIKYEYPYPQPN